MSLGLPSINIAFKEQGISAITKGTRGTVAIIAEDTKTLTKPFYEFYSPSDIVGTEVESHAETLNEAFLGNTNAPYKVIMYFLKDTETSYAKALNYLADEDFDYLAIPYVEEGDLTARNLEVSTWIKSMRSQGKMCKAVLFKCDADHEGIINFATEEVTPKGSSAYSGMAYTARVAGFIAGTDLTISTTYSNFPDLEDVTRMTKTDVGGAIGEGKFIIFKEGGKCKCARGITSLTTTSEAKGESYQKIKVVDILDLIHTDIQRTAQENYLGKYSNSYDNKCLLISAIQGYFDQLELDGLLEAGASTVGIDMEAQRAYLKSIGVNVGLLSEQEIKEYNTKDKVFLMATIKPLDAIEEINLNILF